MLQSLIILPAICEIWTNKLRIIRSTTFTPYELVTGGLPDGSKFAGVSGLENNLLQHPDLFAGTLTEKLLTFALGRGIEPSDAPAVRKIIREAQANDYRFSSVILGIVNSTPFTMRKAVFSDR